MAKQSVNKERSDQNQRIAEKLLKLTDQQLAETATVIALMAEKDPRMESILAEDLTTEQFHNKASALAVAVIASDGSPKLNEVAREVMGAR